MRSSFIKTKIFASLATSLALFLMHTPSLEAVSWGKTEVVTELGGTSWNGVRCDFDDLKLKAMIPNYEYGSFNNGLIELRGKMGEKNYLIRTGMNPDFTPPKTAAAFLKMVQDGNSHANVTIADVSKSGGKFGVDLVPKDPSKDAYWRFIVTSNRLIKLGTDDQDASHRKHFFESISLQALAKSSQK
jgi:hypothetical protein